VIAKGLFDPMMDAGDSALGRVLDAGAAERKSAFDLLAADAFVTWAFEAAAEQPSTIAARADAAMRRMSEQAVRHLGPGEG